MCNLLYPNLPPNLNELHWLFYQYIADNFHMSILYHNDEIYRFSHFRIDSYLSRFTFWSTQYQRKKMLKICRFHIAHWKIQIIDWKPSIPSYIFSKYEWNNQWIVESWKEFLTNTHDMWLPLPHHLYAVYSFSFHNSRYAIFSFLSL